VVKYWGVLFHEPIKERESRILEGHLYPDYVHMQIEIPPKDSVTQVVAYIKEKSAAVAAQRFVRKEKNFIGQNFWAGGIY
jgi:putative transposase